MRALPTKQRFLVDTKGEISPTFNTYSEAEKWVLNQKFVFKQANPNKTVFCFEIEDKFIAILLRIKGWYEVHTYKIEHQ